MISVVIPLYNKQNTIARALSSILNQTFQDFEIIVVNDGSTDGSELEVAGFTDPRIHQVNQCNAGVSAARNRGSALAQGDCLAFLDADDAWMPGFLTAVVELQSRFPQCGAFATSYWFEDECGHLKPARIRGLAPGFEGILTNYFALAARSHPPVWTGAVCIRRALMHDIGGFEHGVNQGEDLLAWARLAFKSPIAYRHQPLAKYRKRAGKACKVTPRIPQESDVVGAKLRTMLQESQKTNRGLRRPLALYVAHWHKMRASCYLRLGRRAQACSETLKALHYAPLSLRNYALLALCVAPRLVWGQFLGR